MEKIADKFEEQEKHKLLLLTKSSNVEFLIERPREQTIVSFSISAPMVWERWEKKTPPPVKRIDAARKVSEIGYETRIRIDPIFPIKNWQRCYDQLLNMIFSKLTPSRITLGTPRGLRKTLMFSKDLSWTEYFAEDSGWGKKLSSADRKEIYLFFHDRLSDLGFNKIALCKETVSMWEELEREAGIFKSWGRGCNCAW
ncbi:MAG: Spore photoproduct lyase [candidate division WS2 bacterium]|uniref:Spore photoproduct lyase n=1 Tax=Psychracetigena formicireducens TaxID=2986056 RepID=A0A9E2BN90_PSYF1|nr:Spore photoproduct lyase [Candidatus Psychracetigena formicireducens]